MKGIYEYVRAKYEITDKKSVREVIAEGQKSGEITVRVNVENKFEPHYCVNSSSPKATATATVAAVANSCCSKMRGRLATAFVERSWSSIEGYIRVCSS